MDTHCQKLANWLKINVWSYRWSVPGWIAFDLSCSNLHLNVCWCYPPPKRITKDCVSRRHLHSFVFESGPITANTFNLITVCLFEATITSWTSSQTQHVFRCWQLKTCEMRPVYHHNWTWWSSEQKVETTPALNHAYGVLEFHTKANRKFPRSALFLLT